MTEKVKDKKEEKKVEDQSCDQQVDKEKINKAVDAQSGKCTIDDSNMGSEPSIPMGGCNCGDDNPCGTTDACDSPAFVPF
jgi:hypothetical protein